VKSKKQMYIPPGTKTMVRLDKENPPPESGKGKKKKKNFKMKMQKLGCMHA